MGKKIFLSYGNSSYYNSLKRIGEEAKATNIFDEIVLVTDKDLPIEITNCELFKYSRGGGYWIWKPYVIMKTLKKIEDDDIVCYCDAGCMIFQDKQWDIYFSYLNKKDAIFFVYGAKMKHWCKKSLLLHYSNLRYLSECYQIQSTYLIVKKKALPIIEEWFKLMYNQPQLVIDVNESARQKENRNFIEHRHDQAVLTCIVYNWIKSNNNIKFLWQNCETRRKNGQAMYAARISDNSIRGNPDKIEKVYITYLKDFFFTPLRSILR